MRWGGASGTAFWAESPRTGTLPLLQSRKKLKKYLIDEKVPKYKRDHLLLFVDDAHIVWAIGYRISEDVKVTKDTEKILEVQVYGGTIHE